MNFSIESLYNLLLFTIRELEKGDPDSDLASDISSLEEKIVFFMYKHGMTIDASFDKLSKEIGTSMLSDISQAEKETYPENVSLTKEAASESEKETYTSEGDPWLRSFSSEEETHFNENNGDDSSDSLLVREEVSSLREEVSSSSSSLLKEEASSSSPNVSIPASEAEDLESEEDASSIKDPFLASTSLFNANSFSSSPEEDISFHKNNSSSEEEVSLPSESDAHSQPSLFQVISYPSSEEETSDSGQDISIDNLSKEKKTFLFPDEEHQERVSGLLAEINEVGKQIKSLELNEEVLKTGEGTIDRLSMEEGDKKKEDEGKRKELHFFNGIKLERELGDDLREKEEDLEIVDPIPDEYMDEMLAEELGADLSLREEKDAETEEETFEPERDTEINEKAAARKDGDFWVRGKTLFGEKDLGEKEETFEEEENIGENVSIPGDREETFSGEEEKAKQKEEVLREKEEELREDVENSLTSKDFKQEDHESESEKVFNADRDIYGDEKELADEGENMGEEKALSPDVLPIGETGFFKNEYERDVKDNVFQRSVLTVRRKDMDTPYDMVCSIYPFNMKKKDNNTDILVVIEYRGEYYISSSFENESRAMSTVKIEVEDCGFLIRGMFVDGQFSAMIFPYGISSQDEEVIEETDKRIYGPDRGPLGNGHIKFAYTAAEDAEGIVEIFPVIQSDGKVLDLFVRRVTTFCDYGQVGDRTFPLQMKEGSKIAEVIGTVGHRKVEIKDFEY